MPHVQTEHDILLAERKKSPPYKAFEKNPIAYFSAEFAIENSLPIYAGGLGVLAGDYFIEAAEQNFPLVGVGLRYKHGQWHKRFSDITHKKGESGFDLDVALSKDHVSTLVSVPMFGRTIYARAWKYTKGSVTLYLLDADVEENTPEDRHITDYLYDSNRAVRLMQELLLGIGGYRLLHTLGIEPSVYHLNEGHSSFVALELASEHLKKHGGGLLKTFEISRLEILFTNHTLIAAGHEVFDTSLVASAIELYAKENGLSVTEIITLGGVAGSEGFSMTALAMRSAQNINAVSVLHSQKAAALWQRPDVIAVTNGVSTGRWDKIWDGNTENVLKKHKENKEKLLAFMRTVSPTPVSWNTNMLLLGWARRFVPYKRPLAVLEHVEALKKLATVSGKEVRILFSGPFDKENREKNPFVSELIRLAEGELKDIVAFIPDYSMETAELMTAGCDVWLNTPEVGSEACGTSGMKAALNGTLPLSTNDGWVAEADIESGAGWIADSNHVGDSLLSIIENSVVPEYYEKPDVWHKRQETARALILSRFSASRMLYEYIEKLYIPIVEKCKVVL